MARLPASVRAATVAAVILDLVMVVSILLNSGGAQRPRYAWVVPAPEKVQWSFAGGIDPPRGSPGRRLDDEIFLRFIGLFGPVGRRGGGDRPGPFRHQLGRGGRAWRLLSGPRRRHL